ncbi:MAG TPA: ABC transporter ATP-binding protein [Candidatus Limnocylindrales bacterium]|nr:ABC transporter ATP-binding protein [Candidatus Limnocylindrales bacterium]
MGDQLQVRGLALSFGAHAVLCGVDLDVPTGRVVALVGPSGCGKTTLVRLVAGFQAPDAGTIELAGRLVGSAGPAGVHVPAERRRVGVVPQEGALFSHLDVAGNVGFGLAKRGRTPEGRARVGHMLDLVGLADLAGRRPDQLSGGQQQRVAVARALAPRPDLVCLDEPFSALDATLRTSVRDAVMGALRAEQASVLLVTHDQDEALSVADVVAVMLDGRIAQVGPPDQVYAEPASVAVAEFLGDAVLLPGTASGGFADCELGRVGLVRSAAGATTLLLRPEQLVPEPMGSGAELAGAHAHVVSVSFHGHDALVSLRTDRGTDLQARVWSGWLPRPGEQVRVGVRGGAWPLPG